MKHTPTIAIAGLMALCLAGCNRTKETVDVTEAKTVYVTVPEGGTEGSRHVFTSAVEEGKSVNVSFKTGGQIRKLMLKEGDRVTQGMTMGVLDDDDYRLSLQQVQAQYDQTVAEVQRLDEMFKRNNIAPNDYEKAKAGLVQLRSQLELVKNKLTYTRLIAPASGYVVEKFMEEGEMAGAGTPVYKILDTAGLETSVALPESVYSQKDKLVSCTGRSSATGDVDIPLEIISFVPDGDNNALFRLRLRIPSAYRNKLLPGMNMTVALNFADESGARVSEIPSRALFERSGKEYVWVVNPDSTISAKEVTVVGRPAGEKSTVEGLSGSETIVAVGVHHLSDKQKVKVAGDVKTLNQPGRHD